MRNVCGTIHIDAKRLRFIYILIGSRFRNLRGTKYLFKFLREYQQCEQKSTEWRMQEISVRFTTRK